ncbi:CHRD domain-containing protein [Hymenobacter artigasi]|uniref:Flp pilus assembly protein TadG n=1 Tax=Hymenobacter artigasi TaxID=2719616 RepID=A0ABX1HCK4_9BACT|nr:CHRD domain-containing protein [Hymenobacter artigasi]NKI87614.1 Flp pilus assembly protein TadG [Hymenobacter artigasi]
MKKSYIFLLASAVSLFTACSKKDDTTPTTNTNTELTATINGAQQVPSNNSTATGTFTGSYNSGTKQLTYVVTYQGMTPTIAHIHTGAPGIKGSVAIPFANLTSPITGTVTLAPEQADNILNNGMYVNIHSSAFSDGEIRGDIKKK